MTATQAAENRGDERGSLNQLTKFSSSGRSTGFKDILPWNISQMITKIVLISMKIVRSYAMKQGIELQASAYEKLGCVTITRLSSKFKGCRHVKSRTPATM